MDISLLDVALIIGLSVRLTRLAVVDTIADPVRVVLIRLVPLRLVDWTHTLLSCPHCIGFWITAAVVASWHLWGDLLVWQAVAATFGLAYLVGHAVARLDGDDT